MSLLVRKVTLRCLEKVHYERDLPVRIEQVTRQGSARTTPISRFRSGLPAR